MAILSGLPKRRRGRQTAAGLARGILTVLSGVQSGRLAKREAEKKERQEALERERQAILDRLAERRVIATEKGVEISAARLEESIAAREAQDKEDLAKMKILEGQLEIARRREDRLGREEDRLTRQSQAEQEAKTLKERDRQRVMDMFSEKTPTESLPGSMGRRLRERLRGRRVDDPETFEVILDEVSLQQSIGTGGTSVTRAGVDPEALKDLEVAQQVFRYFTDLNRDVFFPDATDEEIANKENVFVEIFRNIGLLPQGERIVEEVTGRRDTSGLR